jgi:hypothetical protein
MGGGDPANRNTLLAGGPSDLQQQQQEWYQNLMDDVQFGSRTPRLPIPYQSGGSGPQYDPKQVPIMQGPAGHYFDPYYSNQDALFLAQSLVPGGGDEINPAQLAQILTRLGYA